MTHQKIVCLICAASLVWDNTGCRCPNGCYWFEIEGREGYGPTEHYQIRDNKLVHVYPHGLVAISEEPREAILDYIKEARNFRQLQLDIEQLLRDHDDE